MSRLIDLWIQCKVLHLRSFKHLCFPLWYPEARSQMPFGLYNFLSNHDSHFLIPIDWSWTQMRIFWACCLQLFQDVMVSYFFLQPFQHHRSKFELTTYWSVFKSSVLRSQALKIGSWNLIDSSQLIATKRLSQGRKVRCLISAWNHWLD